MLVSEVEIRKLIQVGKDLKSHVAALEASLKGERDRVVKLETDLKRCAVRVRQEIDIYSSNPADYLYVRCCGLCFAESDESDEQDEVLPVIHKDSCLLYEADQSGKGGS